MKHAEHSKQVALITGSTSGIGAATAERFATDYHVLVTGRSRQRGEAVVDRITRAGGEASFFPADLREVDEAEVLVAAAREIGQLAVLVNNAGGNPDDVPPEEHMATNYYSARNVTYAALPYLSRGASIVNVTSICSTAVQTHEGGAYSDAKAALSSFSRGLARDLAKDGIRVNAVAPGYTDTPDWEGVSPADVQRLSKNVPLLGRFATPEEIAETIYLVHRLPISVGQEIVADGGTTLLAV